MKLDALASVESFALLAPGFSGDGRFLLMTGLDESPPPDAFPTLVFAPFECAGSRARRFSAREVAPVALEVEPPKARPLVTLDDEGYAGAVGAIREAIAAGDVYQVCYTVRATVSGVDGADLLRLMLRAGVPRFAAWVRTPSGEELVSASPELLFEVAGRFIHAEPMKGTSPAGSREWLERSEKDKAELAMITDLLRNDLTPVCRPRSVRVACERRVVALPYAEQTVSDVVGELLPDVTALDALDAIHPGGSVTGAPKRAALGMIERLEATPRGAYCGALGLWREDAAVFSLLIRTAATAGAGWVYGVGSGIVFDSDARAELDELRVKLGALA